MSDRCRSCKAPIRWAVTVEHNRPIPLDADPHPDGNIRLVAAHDRGGAPRAMVIAADAREQLAGELYRSHFATCPFADEHRRR
jgi:hypothetical protein